MTDELDPVFTQGMRGMMPFIVEYLNWAAFMTGKQVGFGLPQTGEDLPLSGRSADDFMRVPRMLSGQSLDDVAAVYEALVRNTRDIDDGVEAFQTACGNIFRNWEGRAQEACAMYGARLMDYVNDERDVTTRLAAAVLAYGAIIKSAREDWVKLANQFLDALAQKLEEDSASGWKVVITALGVIATAALSTTGGGLAIAMTFAGAVYNVVVAAGTEALKESLDGETFGQIGHKFLNACDELEDRVKSALRTEVEDKLAKLNLERPSPPALPVDVGSFDRDPGAELVPEHRTPGVDGWLERKAEEGGQADRASAITNRLGT
ncbi:hypothetical protein [Umezawaea tangerina]|uniref:Uncharacterized protein n=1 Tax=Umezawaea tangerina TaxID=84725 RepID=A0A2T0T6L7_9PSEU|nr:hypothetical protein [Umezawaea tangerina]PRY41299.1 hypothetical protein CLV43_10557 [Umezawaea tangerina]